MQERQEFWDKLKKEREEYLEKLKAKISLVSCPLINAALDNIEEAYSTCFARLINGIDNPKEEEIKQKKIVWDAQVLLGKGIFIDEVKTKEHKIEWLHRRSYQQTLVMVTYLAEMLKLTKHIKEIAIRYCSRLCLDCSPFPSDDQINDEEASVIFEALKSNKSLRILELARHDITDESIAVLAQALKVNNTLKVLDLRENKITEKGAESLAKALEVNKALKILVLDHNPISSISKIIS